MTCCPIRPCNLIIEGSNCDLGVCTDAEATGELFVHINNDAGRFGSTVKTLPLKETTRGVTYMTSGEPNVQTNMH